MVEWARLGMEHGAAVDVVWLDAGWGCDDLGRADDEVSSDK